MYIISVIPVTPGISKDTLTYSSERSLALGSVIKCPFRNKSIDCIVIEVRTLRDAKSDLRSANFVVKKISPTAKPRDLISKHYVQALVNCAHYYGISYSECFNLMLPKSLYSADFSVKTQTDIKPKLVDTEYLEIPLAQTIKYYNTEPEVGIRVIVAPAKERARHLASCMSNKKTILLHSGITVQKQTSILEKISEESDSLYICTPQFISFFQGAEKVYLDNFSSKHYITSVSSYINTTMVLSEYCSLISNSVVAIDSLLLNSSKTTPEYCFKTIDMTDSANGSKYIWQSSYLEKLLENNKNNNKKTFLYVHRKGLSSYLSCNDCRAVVNCSCSSPFTLFEESDGVRTLKCGSCKKTAILDPLRPIACSICGSWKLQGYGVGAEMVYSDLKKLGANAFVIDSEHTKTPKAVSSVYKEFCDTPGSVLVATELALDYIDGQIDSVCIVSIDSLLLLQEYDTDSRVLRKIISLSSFSKTTLYVQTRLPKHPVLQIQSSASYADWKAEYIKDLEEYFLPPFGVSIRIVKKGYFTDKEKDIIDNALEGQAYTHNSFRALSLVTARIKYSVWNDTQTWLPYKLSLLRTTCDVFIE